MGSGYESNGYGMIELDGTITERAKTAGKFAEIIDQNAKYFKSLRPQKSQLALLYNRLSYMTGGNTYGPGLTIRNSYMGFYRAMFEKNIQIDFVHTDEVVSGLADQYKMIYLAYPLMLSEAVVVALRNYVQQGGILVSEARPAWNDERGYANDRIPGGELDEVFGCREKVLRSPEEIRLEFDSKLTGVFAPLSGLSPKGSIYSEHLDVTKESAQVLARFPEGDPAVVVSEYGKGQAMLIGSFPSPVYENEKDEDTGKMLQEIAAWAGVETPIEIDGAPGLVEARYLESEGNLLFIGINHSYDEQEVRFTLKPPISTSNAFNLETGESFIIEATQNGFDFKHVFKPRDVLVLVIH